MRRFPDRYRRGPQLSMGADARRETVAADQHRTLYVLNPIDQDHFGGSLEAEPATRSPKVQIVQRTCDSHTTCSGRKKRLAFSLIARTRELQTSRLNATTHRSLTRAPFLSARCNVMASMAGLAPRASRLAHQRRRAVAFPRRLIPATSGARRGRPLALRVLASQ